MKKLIILLAFATVLGCTKTEVKPSCEVVQEKINGIEQQIEAVESNLADGVITLEYYLSEIDRLATAVTPYYEQLKDCE